MSCGVYKITNLIDNKCYIGQSIHIEKRWQEHRQYSNPENKTFKDSKHLYYAIAKYGINNFKFEILQECSISELNRLEIYYIKCFKSADPNFGYNYQLGGESGRGLTPKYVLEIIEELKDCKETCIELAKRLNLSKRTILRINSGESWPQENEQYPIRTFNVSLIRAEEREKVISQTDAKKAKKIRAKKINSKRIRERGKLSKEEYEARRRETCCKPKYNWPSIDELALELYKSSFEQVGKKYGVSGNAIRKLCKKYNMPTYKKEFIEWYNKNYLAE